MKSIYLIITSFLFSGIVFGQIPPGYYDDAEGLYGDDLREALHDIIDNHDVQSYNSLWYHFESTDQKPNGKVWDMYSDQPDGTPAYEYDFFSDQCGNYNSENDCYNREHSFPKSWFDDAAPMYTDLFHLYPTDGYVNGNRSNHPYGPVGSASFVSTNGSKVGVCSWPSYNGIVFEPIDEYKGDFARSYFYMLTRYMNLVSNWDSDMLAGNDFTSWAREVLLEWAASDPVSQKEIDRNNAVYEIQDNRNPFIDQPEFAVAIWNPTSNVQDYAEDFDFWYANNQLHFSPDSDIHRVEVVSLTGQIVFDEKDISSTSVDLPAFLSTGIYIVRVQNESAVAAKRIFLRK